MSRLSSNFTLPLIDQPIIHIQSDIFPGEMNSEESEQFIRECSNESSLTYSIESFQDEIFVYLARTNTSVRKCVICNKKRVKKNNKLHRLTDTAITDA